MFWNGNVYPVPFICWKYAICHLILTLQGDYSEETLDFETSLRLLYTMGNFEVGLNAFLHHYMSTSLWGPGSGKG